MFVHLLPVGLLVACGLAAAALGRHRRLSQLLGAGGAFAACLLGLGLTVASLAAADSPALTLVWYPGLGASFSVGFDGLSGLFLLAVYALGALCAPFGAGYLGHLPAGRRLGGAWLGYGLLVASMALVLLARNAVLFLLAWEAMSISSWLLVSFDRDSEAARQAGITYLVASQIGTAFLLLFFLLLAGDAGAASQAGARSALRAPARLDFSHLAAPAGGATAGFLLALVGFGTKAGIVPLHVWLPEAHPAAPPHVSALMSGVMIKTGIYGLLRALSLLGAPPAWWGWLLVACGALSGLIGVLFALAQHDIKRLLAYHSVENIGIILLGLGLGLLGRSYGLPGVALLGFAGGLLHVLNHAVFKALLFLGAGAAAHSAGTRDLELLGGLGKRLPLSAACFLVGAAAISGLPPLNGFVSELLIYSAALRAIVSPPLAAALAAALALVALAAIGGLAAACFVKAFGIAFLGQARSEGAAAAREVGPLMLAPSLVLAAACVAGGLLGHALLGALAPLAALLADVPLQRALGSLAPLRGALETLALAGAGLAATSLALAFLRMLLLRGRSRTEAGTWDCGYVAPTARMQYTASSFASPLLGGFRRLLGMRTRGQPVAGLFPAAAKLATESRDSFEHRVFRPVFLAVGGLLSRLRWLQHGRLQLYVLYVAVALLVLLAWGLGFGG